MAFNNTRTILLHGPRGMEWYCPTPARPPWETDKRHPMEQFRDRQFGAMPFPYSQPTILGALATPGWQTRWTWSYIEAQDNPGLTRHFVRRAPDGRLLVPEALVGHTYRILVNAENGVLPATPDADFPEPTPSRSLMSIHCHTKYNEKGEAVDYYYLAYKLPTGEPELPPKVAATKHALKKRDGSWCLLPKTETQVPESWQPIKKQIKNVAQKPVLEVLAEEPALRYEPKGTSAVLKDVLKGSATVVKDLLKGSADVLTNAWDTCTKGATKVMETCRSAFTTEPEEKTQEPPSQKVQQKLETITPISNSNYGNSGNSGNHGNGACTEASRSGNSPNYPLTQLPTYPIPNSGNSGNYGNHGNSGNSPWSWTAIQMNDSQKTLHCLRCSPEGNLLFKKNLIGDTFKIFQKNVNCTFRAEPTSADLEEARSITQVEIAPNVYAVVNLRNGIPELPQAVASQYDVRKNPDGSWSTIHKSKQPKENQNETVKQNGAQPPVLKANAEEPVLRCAPKDPPAVVKEVGVKEAGVIDKAKSEKEPAIPNHGNSGNHGNHGNSGIYPITKSPNYPISPPTYPISPPTYPILEDMEALISTHLVCSKAQRTVLALWILHTYSYTSFLTTPYLNVFSPVEESGKSTCMAVLRGLCAQSWWAAGVSPSAFKRKITAERPTVLLDNWHTVFRGTDKQQMTGFLLSGCDMVRDLCFNTDDPENAGEECTFSPKAFAGLEPLPPVLARRCIPIVLQRRKPEEKVKSILRLMFPERTSKFTSWMKDWTKDHSQQIKEAFGRYEDEPLTLPGLSPHQQQSAKVLVALAETIGGDWPQKARAALLEIFSEYNGSQVSPTQLLSDIRDAFAHYGKERLFSAEVLAYLYSLDQRTYDQWNKQGDPMTAAALARPLNKNFKIYPRTQRRGEERLKGYQQSDFQEAWERYLPPSTATGETAAESEHQDPVSIQAGSQPRPTPVSANKIAPCHDVTTRKSTTKAPARKSPILLSKFKSGCQKALKKIIAKAAGIITVL